MYVLDLKVAAPYFLDQGFLLLFVSVIVGLWPKKIIYIYCGVEGALLA